LGEHLLCKQGVAGSSPVTSTIFSSEQQYPLIALTFFWRRPYHDVEESPHVALGDAVSSGGEKAKVI
jgi:hypothetical protein